MTKHAQATALTPKLFSAAPLPPSPLLQIARQKKKERKAREQLFDVEEDEEEEEEEEESRNERGSSKRHAKDRRGGGADSDSEDEDKDAGVWADNEAEAMLGPGDEAKASYFDRACGCLTSFRIAPAFFRTTTWNNKVCVA